MKITIGTRVKNIKKIKFQIYVSEEIAQKVQELIEKYEWGVSDIFVYAFKKVFINGKKFTQK